jgi:hypothetical protein
MREFLQVAAMGIGVLVGCLWMLIGLLLAGIGWATVRRRLASIFWTRVPARIVASEITSVRRLDDELLHQPVVRYVLAGDREEESSAQIGLFNKLYSSEEKARKEIDRYPVGMVVQARRNPRDPEEIILESGGGLAGISLLLLGIALVAVPVAVVWRQGYPVWPLAIILVLVVAAALLLDAGNRRQLRNARRAGLYPPPGRASDADVERLLRHGERVLAIRLYREVHLTDLKTARMRVDEMFARIRAERSPPT